MGDALRASKAACGVYAEQSGLRKAMTRHAGIAHPKAILVLLGKRHCHDPAGLHEEGAGGAVSCTTVSGATDGDVLPVDEVTTQDARGIAWSQSSS